MSDHKVIAETYGLNANQQKIEKLEEEIKKLEDSLSEVKGVKNSEVMINKELKERIEKQDLVIETLQKLNEHFMSKITDLRIKLKKLINE
jgi:chaperonin cofactor prefoldin|tara:strand:+ start:3321 stop:3590 length:270 start_codon:yes stop_codon:yes gene_type:complete